MRHRYRCPLRWADMDALGHVNNVRYVDYLQEARVDLFRLHGRSALGGELVEGIVVVEHDITFHAPLVFRPAPVTIESWVTRIRAASFTLAYEVFDEADDGRRVYARASTVLSPFVFAAERPRRLSDGERVLLERFLEPAEEARD
ncbi:MAG: acyl-CoA thioesterase [Nocardioidaceae bacterium]